MNGGSPHRLSTSLVWATVALASPAALADDTAPPATTPSTALSVTLDDRGLNFRSADEDFRLKIGGRLQLDVGNGGVGGRDFTDALDKRGEMRRLYFEAYGSLWKSVEVAFQYNFARDDFPIKDAVVAYHSGPFVLSFGNVSEPVGLEELIGANNLTFMEPSLPNGLVPGANTGFTAGAYGERWSFVAGVFGGNINDRVTDRGVAGAARLSYAPILDKDKVLHLAASVSVRRLGGTELSFNNRPESHLFDGSLVSTGTIDGATNVTRFGAEAAWAAGPLRVQSEYVLAAVTRTGLADLRLHGASVEAALVLNAPSGRPYTISTPYGTTFALFDRMPVPEDLRISRGGPGLVELAGRFSYLELSDRDIRGGMERNVTLGINWYPEPYLRLSANYIHADAVTPFTAKGHVEADILMGRLHIRY
jgi:phosphate-selective porin OprO/OprP